MKICPKCHICFTRLEDEFCSNDGARLVLKLDFEADDMVGQTVAGRFDIVGIIGSGGMGTVYKAIQTTIDRVVALKVLRRDMTDDRVAVGRFRREAKAASLLSSPHTITLYEAGEDDNGTLFLAMELLEGASLSSRIFHRTRFPWREALDIAMQIVESLTEAHEKGIVHRDLKPENIFLVSTATGDAADPSCSERPCVKVLDFGIAILSRPERNVDIGLTRTGVIVGTPGYMSPEQAKGLKADARSDLYALGCLLYEMIAGKPPFESDEAVLLMGQHISAEVPPFEVRAPDVKVPEAVEHVIMTMLAKSPDERIQTAREASAAFDALLEGRYRIPASARKRRTTTSFVRRKKNLVLVALVPVVVVAAITLGIVVGLRGSATEASATASGATRSPPGSVDAAAAEETPPLVVVEIEALPRDARITFDGQRTDQNPLRLERPRSREEHSLLIEADGYLPQRRTLRLDQTQTMSIALERLPASATPAQGKRPAPAKGPVKGPLKGPVRSLVKGPLNGAKTSPETPNTPTKQAKTGGTGLDLDTGFPLDKRP